MITVNNLTKIYKTHKKSNNFLLDIFNRQYEEKIALDNIGFDIGDNELVGFIGPNGAGKTTTMKILAGILYPSSGKVNVLGFIPFEKKPIFLKQIAFVMGQKNQLFWELPSLDAFKLNKEIYEIEEKQFNQTLSELTTLLDAKEIINQPVKTLSLGQRMRVELIASLLHRPRILFLDEPTIGLDIFAQTTIINFIKEYQKRYQSSVILTSHYMQDVKRLAKRVILINNGKIIYNGSFKNLGQEFSQNKYINIILNQPLKKDLMLPIKTDHIYNFPQLRIKLNKNNLPILLPLILRQIDFIDLTIEDEPVEEVIKKVFRKNQN